MCRQASLAPSPGRQTHDLELDGLALELDCPDLEVDSDCGDVGLGVGVVCEPEEQARLAHARVTNEQEL